MNNTKSRCNGWLAFVLLGAIILFLPPLHRKYNNYRYRDLFSRVNADPPDYWRNERNYSTAMIADSDRIEKINGEIDSRIIEIQGDNGIPRELATYNLLNYKTHLTRETIVDMIKVIADKLYNSIPDDNYYNFSSLSEENEISYAVAIKKSDIRIIPTDIRIFHSESIDEVQATSIRFGEPLIVLHRTLDNLWSFVRTYNVMGWIKTENIAMASRDEFANYTNMAEFLVAISKSELIGNSHLDMGAKLEIESEEKEFYTVKFPTRDRNGFLRQIRMKVKKRPSLHRGYLVYSEKNIIEQALKYYGTPYVWASAGNGIDCSGLVLNVYSVFGLRLPRNSSKQQAIAGNFKFFNGSRRAAKIKKILGSTKAGSILFFPGHVMLYLGKVANRHYIVQAVLNYRKNNGYGKYEKIYPKQVIVSTLEDSGRSNGLSFMDSLVSVTTIE